MREPIEALRMLAPTALAARELALMARTVSPASLTWKVT